MLSHHMVIEGGKIANYQPYPPTPWNASVRDVYGTPGPYEDAVQNTPIFEENGPENFKGVDIMRAVRSFDPCLPCGVHMYTGGGRVRKVHAHADRDVLSRRASQRRAARTGAAGRRRPGGADRAGPAAHRRARADRRPGRARARRGAGRRGDRALRRGARADLRDRRRGRRGRRASSRERLADDGVVASLMLIHGLYPVALEERVAEALDSVRPYMESHGGDVELLGIEDGVARIRLEGSCDGCPASSSTLELAIKQALDEAAPDLEGLVVEGAVGARRRRPGPGALELPVVQVAPRRRRARRRRGSTSTASTAARRRRADDGAEVARASRWSSPASRAPCSPSATPAPAAARRSAAAGSARASLPAPSASGASSCRAPGRSLDDDRLQLEPVPLLAGAGRRAGSRCAAPMSEALDAQGRGAPPGGAGRRACAGSRGPSRPAPTSARRRRRDGAAGRALRPLRQAARPPTTATCSTSSSAGSSAPARAASRCAAAIPSCARPAPGPSGSTTSSSPTRPGRRSGSRSGSRSSSTRAPPAGSSRSTRAPPGRPSPSSSPTPGATLRTLNPVLDGPRARRRGADRQPDGRPAPVRDRADRRVLPARRPDQGRAGRGSRAAPGPSARSPAFFAELAGARPA